MLEPKPVLFSEQKLGKYSIGFIELNRSNAINSLDLTMVRLIYKQLNEWRETPGVAAIFLHSENPKGFCAGGDVKQVVLKRREDPSYADQFFEYEYLLDELMSRFEKPIVCWGDGIVMGGGLGLFMASSHRIVTENSVLAMPETAIGFFPDVGASYFLNRLPRRFGWFLGLTGHRLKGAEPVMLKMADALIPAKEKRNLIAGLLKRPWTGSPEENHRMLAEFIGQDLVIRPELQATLEKSEELFQSPTLEESLSFWERTDDALLKSGLQALRSGSFHSVQVIWEQMHRGLKWSRGETAWREWDMAHHFSTAGDFHEGVRALLIDKDKTPRWGATPLDRTQIAAFFTEVPGNPVKKRLADI